MKFVHAADIHLDSPLHGLERYEGAPRDELRGATRRALRNLVDLCLDESAAFLLIAGDLYDGDWRDFGTGLFFAAEMARLNDAGVRVFVVHGNHDAASRITRNLRLPANVHRFDSRRATTVADERLGIAVHGQSFASEAITDNLAAAYPEPTRGLLNIGLLHSSADGRPGHENYAPCRVPDLVGKGYDYWALGHVHAREVLHRDPWVVFPGNLQGRHAREIGPKGCTLVTVENGCISAVEPRALDVVRWGIVEVDAAEARSPHEILDRLAGALRTHVDGACGRTCAVRVRLAGRTAAHATLLNRAEAWIAEVRALATDVGRGSLWIEKVLLETSPEIDWVEVAKQHGPTAELVAEIEALRGDESRLAQLAAQFTDLNTKLPGQLKEGADDFRIEASRLRDLLAETPSLLLPRLLGAEDDE